jgi:hypothetical protein
VAGVALQLFGLGIPCIYYGTEQAFAGPEKSEREQYLPDYNAGSPPPDKYLREAMFGPEHPRKAGAAGIGSGADVLDTTMVGFGPFGTSGAHAFDAGAPAFVRIAALARVRQEYPVLRYGRLYPRQISPLGGPFVESGAGELIAWSRILDEEEALCIVNGHGGAVRGADVIVDAGLNAADASGQPWGQAGPSFQVLANSFQAAHESVHPGVSYDGPHPVGERVPVRVRGVARYVEIRGVPPSEVLVLGNRE